MFKAKELKDAEVNRGVETQSAFVRADSAVELNSVTDVHLYLSLIVDPWNAERDDALRFNDAFDDACLFKFGMLVVNVLYRDEHLANSLQILRLAWMFLFQGLHDFFNFHR